MRRALPLVVLLVLGAGCGKSSSSSAPSTSASRPTVTPTPGATTSGTETSEATTLLRVYFLRNGKVGPVARNVPATQAVGSAALQALGAGPTGEERAQGLRTEVSSAAAVTNLQIADGVATIELQDDLSHAALAQVVYTLTQFSTVERVRPSRVIGGAKAFTRADFEDVTPSILVESPLPGQAVTSPLEVRGTANTFEATFDLAIRNSSGVTVSSRFVTATSGSGTRGTYDTTISFPHTGGPITLVAFEPSAENGKPIHIVGIPLREG
jgi:germination protein M